MTRYCVFSADGKTGFYVWDKEYDQAILPANSWRDAAAKAGQLNESIHKIEKGVKWGKSKAMQEYEAKSKASL